MEKLGDSVDKYNKAKLEELDILAKIDNSINSNRDYSDEIALLKQEIKKLKDDISSINENKDMWILYESVTGSDVISIDFSKYKNIKFVVKGICGTTTYRVIERTIPSSFFLEQSTRNYHVLMASPATSWLYAWLLVENNSVKIGGAYNDNTDVMSTTQLYVYVQ